MLSVLKESQQFIQSERHLYQANAFTNAHRGLFTFNTSELVWHETGVVLDNNEMNCKYLSITI